MKPTMSMLTRAWRAPAKAEVAKRPAVVGRAMRPPALASDGETDILGVLDRTARALERGGELVEREGELQVLVLGKGEASFPMPGVQVRLQAQEGGEVLRTDAFGYASFSRPDAKEALLEVLLKDTPLQSVMVRPEDGVVRMVLDRPDELAGAARAGRKIAELSRVAATRLRALAERTKKIEAELREGPGVAKVAALEVAKDQE